VQDLRRVNAATRNVKKTIPKLPEQIFQKLRGKIVSSIDASQAYWHLQLDPKSRPYACFYLRNRSMQFNHMVQGLTSTPACWDQAMGIIFSDATLAKLKAKLPKEQAEIVPDSFLDFFTYYQDDSWIFSDTPEEHLLHLKLVLQAYIMYNIRISPQKSTFFPESFKILGVQQAVLSRRQSEEHPLQGDLCFGASIFPLQTLSAQHNPDCGCIHRCPLTHLGI
jgi:Reverse transcriptase (RNA-dependent DNA polymerase)